MMSLYRIVGDKVRFERDLPTGLGGNFCHGARFCGTDVVVATALRDPRGAHVFDVQTMKKLLYIRTDRLPKDICFLTNGRAVLITTDGAPTPETSRGHRVSEGLLVECEDHGRCIGCPKVLAQFEAIIRLQTRTLAARGVGPRPRPGACPWPPLGLHQWTLRSFATIAVSPSIRWESQAQKTSCAAKTPRSSNIGSMNALIIVVMFACTVAMTIAVCGCGFRSPTAGVDDALGVDVADGTDAGTRVSTFRQGEAGYAGAQDTFLHQGMPVTPYGANPRFECDLDAVDGNETIGLLRFDAVFGAGSGQIPLGAAIVSAMITVQVTDPSAAAGSLHESLIDWSQAVATWDSFGGDPGVQPDEIGPVVGMLPVGGSGPQTFNVGASLAAWSSGRASTGWVLLAASSDGLTMRASEDGNVALRPSLQVVWR